MNPVWTTQVGGRKRSDPKAIEHDWASGLEFRVYRYATLVSRRDTDLLLRAGFTCVRVVYQRADLSVGACDIDLIAHKERS